MRTAKEYRQIAWDRLIDCYWWMVLAALIALALGGTSGMSIFRINFNSDSLRTIQHSFSEWPRVMNWLPLVGLMVASTASVYGIGVFIVGGAVELGYDRLNVRMYEDNAQPEIGMLFSRFSIFGRALWLRVLIGLKVFAWSLLLVVPGIIAAYRYAMAPYLVAENPDITASDAIEQSKQIMYGKKWSLFCLHFSFIGWYLLAGLTAGIGLVFLQPYVKAAETAFYLDLSGRLGRTYQSYQYNAYTAQDDTAARDNTAAQGDAAGAEGGPQRI